MSDSQAYASAIERAQQINSKISAESQYYQTSSQAGMKRSAQQSSYDPGLHSSEKRPFLNDKTASAAAAEAVARLNQKLGVQQQPPQQLPSMPQSFPGQYAASNQPTTMPGATQTASVTIKIPDRLVGLIIGKRGEQITALQAESNCKVQITQEQTGPERPITLTGLPQQIEHARRMIGDLISRAERGGPPMPHQPQMSSASGDNFTQIEIMVPGNKAGLVIGKGGETIKSLQEEHGVKMVLIQQSNQATLEDKPLRISGDSGRVERVKQLIIELINGKTTPAAVSGRSDGQDFQRYAVPAEKAGLVIGKGGETIKEICKLSNCHVEISKDPPPSQALKLFNIRGTPEDIMKAKKLISDRAGVPLTNDSYGASSGYNVYAYMQDQPQPAANGGNMPAPSVNPYTGMLDYSAAWIEYYRRLGMPEQAEKIMLQAQQQGLAGNSQTPVGQPPAGTAQPAQQPGGAQGGADYAQQQQQWAAWQQWQQWQQQQQAQQQQQQWSAGNVPQSGQTN